MRCERTRCWKVANRDLGAALGLRGLSTTSLQDDWRTLGEERQELPLARYKKKLE